MKRLTIWANPVSRAARVATLHGAVFSWKEFLTLTKLIFWRKDYLKKRFNSHLSTPRRKHRRHLRSGLAPHNQDRTSLKSHLGQRLCHPCHLLLLHQHYEDDHVNHRDLTDSAIIPSESSVADALAQLRFEAPVARAIGKALPIMVRIIMMMMVIIVIMMVIIMITGMMTLILSFHLFFIVIHLVAIGPTPALPVNKYWTKIKKNVLAYLKECCRIFSNNYLSREKYLKDISDLQMHVPDTQKPWPEQLGSWQSTEKEIVHVYI